MLNVECLQCTQLLLAECHLFDRIFVNRSLYLEKIKFFGFDMDYTLAGEVEITSITEMNSMYVTAHS